MRVEVPPAFARGVPYQRGEAGDRGLVKTPELVEQWRRSYGVDSLKRPARPRRFDAVVDVAELDREQARAWTLVRTVDY